MKNKTLKVPYIFLLLFYLILIPIDLFGYGNEEGGVHDRASRRAWDRVIQKRNFLQDLGFTEDDIFYQGKKAEDWVALGSRFEDGEKFYEIIRTKNHFYDPVQKIGLNDPCGLPFIVGLPSPDWGLGYHPDNNWDFKDARRYEYIALTDKDLDEDGRKKYFAKMFRSIGQVMHLVQDSAVPEHVRNDAHALPGDRSLYEAYASTKARYLNYGGYQLVNLPAYYCFFDTGHDTCESVGDGMGMAEFTNRNFVSQSTNFDDTGLCRQIAGIYDNPQPEFSNVEEETVPLPGGGTKTFWVHYVGNMVSDLYTGNPPAVNKHLSAYSWWDFEKQKEFNERVYSLNDNCFQATAHFVIPRAVGYSAGLLDYFFRGKIEITEPSAVGGSLTLLAKNVTEGDEEMSDGDITLVAKYSIQDEIYYTVASANARSIPRDEPVELSFPNNIPDDAEDITLQVVYRGELGEEEDAVAVGLTPYIPKLIIVLHKEDQGETDWWYYLLDDQIGYHSDFGFSLPTSPTIISKWWSCEGLEEVEYFTRVSPAFHFIGSGGCGDNCGLINFKAQWCCSGSSSAPNDSKSWGTCPCGGEWKQGAHGWYCGIGPFECSGGTNIGNPFSESRVLAGCGNNYNRTSNVSRPCPKGASWGLAVGDLTEKIDVGPRSRTSGYESKTTCIVHSATCGPYPYSRRCCSSWKDSWDDPCRAVGGDTWLGCCGKWDPYSCGTECKEGYDQCTNWFVKSDPNEPGPAAWRWSGATHYGSPVYGGCLDFTSESKSAGYSRESVPLTTRVKVGEVETLFEGSWSQYTSSPGTASSVKRRDGFANSCQPCQKEALGSSSYSHASYSYSEQSYGVDGWRTVVASDGKFAVLIPKMNLSASATSTDGNASGGISSTTTALLRIVDIIDENPVEIDFELAQADMGYSLNGMPGSRDDLGIKPNCWPRDLPLDIELRGLHWYGDDSFLVAFFLKDVFYAYLIKKDTEQGWLATQLTDFEQWVSDNDLTGYLMFLK